MAADLDPGFLRQRRNLLMISIALLLFELADGNLTGVSLVAPVTFEREWVVLLFGWVAFFYLWWRYRIRSKDMWEKVRQEWRTSVLDDRRYRHLAVELRTEQIRAQYPNQAQPLILRDWRSRKLEYARNLDGSHSQSASSNADSERSAPFWRVLAIECRGILSATIRLTVITDYVLPQVIAGATLIVGIGLNVDSIFRWLGEILGLS